MHLLRLLESELIGNLGRVACAALLLLAAAGCGSEGAGVVTLSAGTEAEGGTDADGGTQPQDATTATASAANSDPTVGVLENLVIPGGVSFSRLGQAPLDELALRAPLRDVGSSNVFRPLPALEALPLQPPARVLDVLSTRAPAGTDPNAGKATVFLASFTNEVMGSREKLDFVDVPAYVLVVDDMPGFGRRIGGVNSVNVRQPTDCRSVTVVDALTAELLTTEIFCG